MDNKKETGKFISMLEEERREKKEETRQWAKQ